jgi:hypothetical protein
MRMITRTIAASSAVALLLLLLLLATPAFAQEEPAPLPETPAPIEAPPAPAAADVPPPAPPNPVASPPILSRPPRNAVSVQLLSFFNHGVTLQYERQLVSRVSVATSLNRRWSGGGDTYDVTEMGVGTEGRVWLVGRGPLTKWDGLAMVGPYIGVRFDLGQTRVEEVATDRLVGTSLRISETLTFGARIVIAKYFELTPSYGIGFRTEVDPRGRLATWTRFEPMRWGMTAGVMF